MLNKECFKIVLNDFDELGEFRQELIQCLRCLRLLEIFKELFFKLEGVSSGVV